MAQSKQQTSEQKTTQQDPWAPAADPIKASIPQVGQLYDQRLGQDFFPGQTYAGFDPSQQQALQQIEGTAGHGLTAAAKDYTGRVLAGDYLNPNSNPYVTGVAKLAADEAQARTSAQWGRAGRGTGNMDVVGATTKASSDAAMPFLNQNYQNERAIQEAATGRANFLDYADSDRLFAAGAERQGMDQKRINEEMARFQFGQDKEANALKEKLGILTPLAQLGGTSQSHGTSTTTSTPSALQMGTGLAMTAAGAYMGMPGMGMGGMSPMQSLMQSQNMRGVYSPFAGQQQLPWMGSPTYGSQFR